MNRLLILLVILMTTASCTTDLTPAYKNAATYLAYQKIVINHTANDLSCQEYGEIDGTTYYINSEMLRKGYLSLENFYLKYYEKTLLDHPYISNSMKINKEGELSGYFYSLKTGFEIIGDAGPELPILSDAVVLSKTEDEQVLQYEIINYEGATITIRAKGLEVELVKEEGLTNYKALYQYAVHGSGVIGMVLRNEGWK